MKRGVHTVAPHRVTGFTLVELVVALSLVTVMMTLLFSGLRLGARVWDTVEQRTVVLHDNQLTARFIVRELEQARALTFAPRKGDERLAFLGNAQAVYFVAPLPSHAGGGGLHWIGLELVTAGEERRLVLTYELFQANGWERYDSQPRQRLVLYDKVADGAFAYFGAPGDSKQARWSGTWDDPEKLPQLVRLRLQGEQKMHGVSQELLAALKLSTAVSERTTGKHGQRRTL